MISKAERQHLVILKQWSKDSRDAVRSMNDNPVIKKVLERVPEYSRNLEQVFENVDWLISLIEREEHRYGVRALTGELKRHEQ